MSSLHFLLDQFRTETLTVRDQGTSFENLIVQYLKTEPFYKDQYTDVLPYADWVENHGAELGINTKKDTGIDLVATTHDGLFHAIQCKNYADTHRISKSDIDSFFTASGKSYFSQRIIVTTTNHWTENAKLSLENQVPPVSLIDLTALENSVIDWSKYNNYTKPVLKPLKSLREHQKTALDKTIAGLKNADRGKLIMACGTGKTFTSLKIAEAMAGKGKRVLFLVPSLSLLGQTITEWTQESAIPLKSFAVCSDSDVGKRQSKDDDDRVITGLSDLQYPATTNATALNKEMQRRHSDDSMTVVFSTYHSIAVINEAQAKGLPAFDLIICDEAHRTTGATFDGDEESAFVRIHENTYIQGHKRIYMTATPRIYGTTAKDTEGVTLCSMDDESIYGKELYVITFSEAVSRKLLVDYKVIVLAIEESHINRRLQSLLTDTNNSLKVDDAAKIVGCWKALSKQGLFESSDTLAEPMKRAVAFCQVIEKEYKGNKHKVSSKQIAEMFGAVVEQYQEYEKNALLADDPNAQLDPALFIKCEAEHVDGSMNASEKEAKLNWLKATTEDNTCRILSNVRCLSEGVDVPALDAVLFLTPRSSEVDVVQSVGRVMRTVKDQDGNDLKKMGYVILPVVIPAGVAPEEALNNNETYKVVWQVLNALRAHDDRFDAMINKLEFNKGMPSKMEVVAVAENVTRKAERPTKSKRKAGDARGGSSIGNDDSGQMTDQATMQFEVGEIERALYAQIVKKCGNRHHWEDWANDIAKIANTHIDRIRGIIENTDNHAEITAFNAFAAELRDDLNNSISNEEIIEMLAQHLITKPVFDALFESYSFTSRNPMSKAMQAVLDTLQEHHLEKERDTLNSFYESVKMRAEGIDSAEGKQRIVVELYDKFFRNAFPRMTERLGIVYTPVEVVDFIIHSIEDVLQDEFGKSLADDNVHIIDPFTGTGTFITRLLQSGIIPKERLPHKYQHELHANEIVLLAYYIAAINIEATYHGILNNNVTGAEESDLIFETEYQPFEGICLTDTFQMYETEDMVDALLEENSARRKRQKELDITVIMGNPPYSVGQASDNDDNANVKYPSLELRLQQTYIKHGTGNPRSLYDTYIKSFRWASDRIGEQGVVCFVTNGGFLEANNSNGMRKCLAEEFSNIHIFHLRGNARTSGELRRKEKDNVFGMGTRTPIAISLLVKNPNAREHGQILFHDIGDYLSREEKLGLIANYTSIKGIPSWQHIVPDQYGDWLNQRDDSFKKHIVLGDKGSDAEKLVLFKNYSSGIKTNRDAWVFDFSQTRLETRLRKMIDFYNESVEKLSQESLELPSNPNEISWSHVLRLKAGRGTKASFTDTIKGAMYRPFIKQHLYYDGMFIENRYQMPSLFPTGDTENLVIQVTGRGSTKEFSAFIVSLIPDLELISKGQCFPLYLYGEQAQEQKDDLFGEQTADAPKRRDAITDEGLAHFQSAYPELTISKEDLFYYVYGLLHSEDYRTRFADNLSKELPRIPRVKTAKDFTAFSQAGRELAHWHLDYETVALNATAKLTGKTKGLTIDPAKGVLGGQDEDFRVTKMKFGKMRAPETGKSINDKTTVIYNSGITIENIPLEAYDYIVNGKPALEWVMERQAVTTHKASGITNDANDWAIETMGNAKYPLELFLRVITVSLETQKIVNSLPKLDI